MANDPNLERLRLRIRDRMNDLADQLSVGAAKSYESYREVVGEITGLAVAERELIEIDALLSSDDDEEAAA